MTIIVRDGTNTPRTITGIVVRDGTNTPRTISEIWVRDTTNTPRLVYNAAGSPLTAVAAPDSPLAVDTGTGTATTADVTTTPSGGVGPYTYAWALISYDAGVAPTILSPTAATTKFVQTGLAPGDYFTALFRCTVTDSLLNTATADCNAGFYSGA